MCVRVCVAALAFKFCEEEVRKVFKSELHGAMVDVGLVVASDAPMQITPAEHKGAAIAAAMSKDEYKTDRVRYVRSGPLAQKRMNYFDKVPESLALKIINIDPQRFQEFRRFTTESDH